MNHFDTKLDIREYLADRGTTSGSALSLVESNPVEYGRWLLGKAREVSSAAMGRGSLLHARLLEPETIARSFAFYPNRNEAQKQVMEPAIGTRGAMKGKPLKKLVPTDRTEPQDGSPAGRFKRLDRSAGDFAKAQHDSFMSSAVGLSIVYPEDQPIVNAMVRAVQQHPEASALLERMAPEVTGFFTCPITGERVRFRPDGLNIDTNEMIEIKSVAPKVGRLDTLDPAAVVRWIRSGWARKSAICHDGYAAITGRNATMTWIIVEATTEDPIVSVVTDECDSYMARLGRDGCSDAKIRGYLELIRLAQWMREEWDFRPLCSRGVLDGFPIPAWLSTSMQFEENAAGAPALTGARQVANG